MSRRFPSRLCRRPERRRQGGIVRVHSKHNIDAGLSGVLGNLFNEGSGGQGVGQGGKRVALIEA
eukprot:10466241-Alexandrium_andersonii.AAC.1